MEPWRDVPALAVVGDDGHGLPIVASQHADEPAMSVRLKGDAIADLELEHLGMRSHLSQKLEPGNDSVVQVHEFRLGQPIDVDPHALPAHWVAPARDLALQPSFLEPQPFMQETRRFAYSILTTPRKRRPFGSLAPRVSGRVTPAMPGSPVDPRSLRDAIAREESRLVQLKTELGHTQVRLAELKTILATHGEPVEASPSAPSTASEKVALFRSRFRGRDDIYPRFWSNTRTGRKGYAPACRNEWIRGVCEKPRVKCGECPNQAFLPVEDKVILDHLQGRHVVGVYPLLADDTCWFLAADFDKASWTDDVAAFTETCHAHGLPAAVERSRSGNGAHVWSSSRHQWQRRLRARWAAISSPRR